MPSIRETFDTDYKTETAAESVTSSETSTKKLISGGLFDLDMGSEAEEDVDEIADYISGKLCHREMDIAVWWKDHTTIFPRLSRMARDFLGNSIFV